MNNVLERLPGAVTPALGQASSAMQRVQNGFGASQLFGAGGDAIRRMPTLQQQFGNSMSTLPFGGGIIQQLLSIISQLLQTLGMGGGLFGQPGQPGFTGDQYFQNATASSTGDPHLAFNGTTMSGQNDQQHFDSMIGHNDLLDSDSFNGEYQVSTTVTQPAANGVTYNQSATITTNYGGTQVCLDNAGNASIVQNGRTMTLANGQTVDLGNGETVTRNADGSVAVSDCNGQGGLITTTIKPNGQGVDVSAQAQNVDLGGDLVNQPPSGQYLPPSAIAPPLQRYGL